jgi:ribosome maturation factor RimP
LDDCQIVSHQISGLLDVEDPIPGNYTLEVSSPGLDRPLFEAEHYARFVGHRVHLLLNKPLDNNLFNNKRKFTGLLRGIQDNEVHVEIEGLKQSIPLDTIEKARLVPEI